MPDWSSWVPNPFKAIRLVALLDDAVTADGVLTDVSRWESIDPATLMDDLLQEIAGVTNIVVQYDAEAKLYRAAYDETR